ncbi:uncharacterized protein LOC119273563 [Triticum dicoccoides]|uniref:uncharacterized protein LOC119273563 n=1 Tax=Triticum dicoccoides TaxID=85692 RepID=UPI00189094B5|nr:uncharacterized protein LOC119273563 [Triticum dicoccoides]
MHATVSVCLRTFLFLPCLLHSLLSSLPFCEGYTLTADCSCAFDGLMPAAPLAGVGSASSVAQTIHGSSGYPFSLPADVHLDHRLVGAPSVVNRSKGVPLRVAGAFGRPTPLVTKERLFTARENAQAKQWRFNMARQQVAAQQNKFTRQTMILAAMCNNFFDILPLRMYPQRPGSDDPIITYTGAHPPVGRM